MARTAEVHEVQVALNLLFADTVGSLRAKFDTLIPQDNIVTFAAPGPVAEQEPANAWRRCAAERIREHFLAGLGADIVHVSSMVEGFCDDSITSVGLRTSTVSTAATFYDAIPLLHPTQYLSIPNFTHYYLRKVQWLKRVDVLFAISESSRREAIDVLHIPENHVVNISTGIEEKFRPIVLPADNRSSLLRKYGITNPFLMYVGGVDKRKNLEGLIAAVALLPLQVRENCQLLVAGQNDPATRKRLLEVAINYGLRDNTVLCPGYVNDEDLIALYNLCSLFILPSFHEGFGLPVLEAMACGAPSIASNVTSLPEVMGWRDAMFNPYESEAIAAKIVQVLSDDSFREKLRQNGLQQVKRFSWDRTAKIAWGAFEELKARSAARREHFVAAVVSQHRSRLAYFSPLPPQRSGISNYSAELLPELARYYDIEVVVEQESITDDWVIANFPVRTVRWFDKNVSRYDRLLYHVGNSPFHVYIYEALRQYPGTVVLHDFYLSAMLSWIEESHGLPSYFREAIFHSHGYRGLLDERELGRGSAVRTLPCSRTVIEAAAGVIVHSEFACTLGKHWYGPATVSDWRVIPLPKAIQLRDRHAARSSIGLGDDDYLVCSFGFVDPTKLSDRVLSAWLNSRLRSDKRCRLVFVGENHGGEYGRHLLERAAAHSAGRPIAVTGFVSPEDYRDYLSAADCAVQLRTDSRGETSAALLDCLAYGRPTIINSHGSFADIPGTIACKLPDEFTDAQLAVALDEMYLDTEYRRTLSKSARDHVELNHHPARVAELYRNAIDSFAMASPLASEQRLLRDLAAMSTSVPPSHRDLVEASRAIAMHRQRRSGQLILDVSATAKHDLGTGIERAARNLARELIRNPGTSRVEPVHFVDGRRLYARNFALDLIDVKLDLKETVVEFRSGDLYLGLDWCPEAVVGSCNFFADLRALNIPIYFTIYDLLPILHPEKFPDWTEGEFRRWLTALCEVSDGLICISRSVADELSSWLDYVQPARLRPLKIGYFHLGADFDETTDALRRSFNSDPILSSLAARPSVLMVGTLEPRKGHSQALAAFDQLWRDNVQVNLVIVGKLGWQVESLIEQIQKHRQIGKRLFWLDGVSDEMLTRIYSVGSVLLAASEGEGFGLPLIEAARNKLPIIARDLPVFREVAGDHAYYFDGTTGDSLADTIRKWLDLHSRGQAPSSQGLEWLSWKESAGQLMGCIIGQRSYREWHPRLLRGARVITPEP
jgi:glycosyltransferase involved in cell wall biosynthesis